MELLEKIVSINSILIEIWDYPLSYIECIGTMMGLWSVWLATKTNIHTWTTGFINVIAFFVIFYQIQLYSDMMLQVFFFATSIVGLYQWNKKKYEGNNKKIIYLDNKSRVLGCFIIILSTLALGFTMSNIHRYLPTVIPQPASFPYADALTTVLSIYATFLMAWKRVECWVLWIIVDVICVFLYYYKGIHFVATEYLVFLIMATMGLIEWAHAAKETKSTRTGQVYARA